jgi:hypothetical protein
MQEVDVGVYISLLIPIYSRLLTKVFRVGYRDMSSREETEA